MYHKYMYHRLGNLVSVTTTYARNHMVTNQTVLCPVPSEISAGYSACGIKPRSEESALNMLNKQ